MKRRNIIYVLLASVALLFAACNKQVTPEGGTLQIYNLSDYQNEKFDNPVPFDKVILGTPLMFVVKNADADVYSLWMGATGADYELRDSSSRIEEPDTNFVSRNSKGLSMTKNNKGEIARQGTYLFPGDFELVVLARNIYNKGADFEQTEMRQNITVVDTTCVLFGAPGDGEYRFEFTGSNGVGIPLSDVRFRTPSRNEVIVELNYNARQMTNDGTDISMAIKAGRASIWVDSEKLPFENDAYQWKNVNLKQEGGISLTVKASPGFEREYKISARNANF